MNKLEGKITLVTDGTSGIGLSRSAVTGIGVASLVSPELQTC